LDQATIQIDSCLTLVEVSKPMLFVKDIACSDNRRDCKKANDSNEIAPVQGAR
jgi:hypothetical protein